MKSGRNQKPSHKSQNITSFIVMDILEAAKKLEAKGRDVVHFEVGEPDFETPRVAREAGIKAIREGKTRYTHSQGTIELREAICDHYKKEYRVKVEPERVIVTNGSSAALFIAFAALLNSGDEVVMANPHYACYPNYVNFLGGKPVYVMLSEKEGFQLPVARVKRKITKRTKAVLINSPSNPTGVVLKSDVMKKIAALGETFGKIIVSDEIYHGLTYGIKARSILEYTDDAMVVNGFSKRFAMTGWRVGYVIAPQKLVRPMQKVQQNFHISAAHMAQEAALAALTKGKKDAERMRKEFDKRRKVMLEGLRKIGFKVKAAPHGAFYFLVSCAFLDKNSLRLAMRILEEANVAVTPGVDFGSGGEGFLRFTYATSLPRIREGLKRLGKFIEKEKG